jgi:DDE superfamily endonuclease
MIGRLLLWIVLSVLLDLASGAKAENKPVISQNQLAVIAMLALAAALDDDSEDELVKRFIVRRGKFKTTKRVRRPVQTLFAEYGPSYFRRAYRMNEAAFWELHALLKPYMISTYKRPAGRKPKTHRKGTKNGIIASEARLSIAIRYFAGGRPDDISVSHGVSHSEVFVSVWQVVDAVNRCPALDISFPECHDEQRKMALAFQEKSEVGIDCCVAAIDGLLLWIEKPSSRDCRVSTVGAKKFFCGRKHKFGMNFQGTCDARGRFVDISIRHPASTSDFLAFSTSTFQSKIERPGFLAPGLCIFGDAAYVNNGYFVTPYKNVRSGKKDNFNYFQSQLRITIECCFGMLVGRWGILRRAFPQAMSLKKITAMTLCLCRLHNFCIDHRGGKTMALALPSDDAESIAQRGLGNEITSEDLLHGSEHHIDTTRGLRQEFARTGLPSPSSVLPRDRLLKLVEKTGFTRPLPKRWES